MWAVGIVARHVARGLAADELSKGSLHLGQDVMVLDSDDAVVARYPLTEFLNIDDNSLTG